MTRPASSNAHRLALVVALVATAAAGVWAVFDDGLPSVSAALASFSGNDTGARGGAWPAAGSWSGAPGAAPGAGAPSAQPVAGGGWPSAQPVAGGGWPSAQPSAQAVAGGGWPSAQPWAQPVAGGGWPSAQPAPSRPTPGTASAAPPIVQGATAPHGYRGQCTDCHLIVPPAGMPVAGTAAAPAQRAAPPPREAEWKGLEVRSTPQGVEVAGAEGIAATAGLSAGDVVASINGVPTPDLAAFAAVTDNGGLAQGTVIALRGGQRVAFELGAPATGPTGAPTGGGPGTSPAGAPPGAAFGAGGPAFGAGGPAFGAGGAPGRVGL